VVLNKLSKYLFTRSTLPLQVQVRGSFFTTVILFLVFSISNGYTATDQNKDSLTQECTPIQQLSLTGEIPDSLSLCISYKDFQDFRAMLQKSRSETQISEQKNDSLIIILDDKNNTLDSLSIQQKQFEEQISQQEMLAQAQKTKEAAYQEKLKETQQRNWIFAGASLVIGILSFLSGAALLP
jgi:hypothetical protein